MFEAITPAASAAAVTPDDETNIEPTRGLYLGTGGDLKVMMLAGTAVTFANLAAGIIHPIVAIRIYATGTTAGDIVALR